MSARIVFAIDGTPAADRALELLRNYSGDKSELQVLLHNVQERPFAFWPEPSIDVRSIKEALAAHAPVPVALVK